MEYPHAGWPTGRAAYARAAYAGSHSSASRLRVQGPVSSGLLSAEPIAGRPLPVSAHGPCSAHPCPLFLPVRTQPWWARPTLTAPVTHTHLPEACSSSTATLGGEGGGRGEASSSVPVFAVCWNPAHTVPCLWPHWSAGRTAWLSPSVLRSLRRLLSGLAQKVGRPRTQAGSVQRRERRFEPVTFAGSQELAIAPRPLSTHNFTLHRSSDAASGSSQN